MDSVKKVVIAIYVLLGSMTKAHETKAYTKSPHRQMPTVINAHTKNTHTDNCSDGK
jgi:hypothetical protein